MIRTEEEFTGKSWPVGGVCGAGDEAEFLCGLEAGTGGEKVEVFGGSGEREPAAETLAGEGVDPVEFDAGGAA